MNIMMRRILPGNTGKEFWNVRRLLFIGSLFFILILTGATASTQLSGVNREESGLTMLSNPAAVYCQDMGYEYETLKEAGGDRGVCHLPEQITCGAWEYLEGTCGQEYSYCAQQGYQISTKKDGNNPYSSTYGVCVTEEGKEIGSVVDLSQLTEKALGCQGKVLEQGAKPEVDLDQAYIPPDAAPPTSFDWRNNSGDWLTVIKDQGTCGSCWAFSAVGVAEAAYNIEAGNPALDLDLSEQYLVSDCHTYSGYQTCCGGWKDVALEYIRDYGIPDEGCLPYGDETGCTCYEYCGDVPGCTYDTYGECSNSACSDRCGDWEARLEHITDVGSVSSDPTTIKQALVDIGPLAVSLDMGGTFDEGGIFRCATEDGSTNHAVSIVGYSDSGGYWIARNSWGNIWNGDGYFKVGYGECSIEEYVYYTDATAVTAPANDDVADAIDITALPYTNTQSTLGATMEESEPPSWCGWGAAASVWYTFTPGTASLYELDTLGSNYDTILDVYENVGGGSYFPISCNDDDDISYTSQSRTLFYGESGIEYLIGVTDHGSGTTGSEQVVQQYKDKVGSEPDQSLDMVGGDLTLNLDSYSCPSDAICATVVDHFGYPLAYPSLHVYHAGGNYIDTEYSSLVGYAEFDGLSPGSYDVDLTGSYAFITETGWGLGYHHASAELLPPVDIVAFDKDGNPTIDGDVYFKKRNSSDWVGWFWEGDYTTIWATPGVYDIDVIDWWDEDYLLSLQSQAVPGAGAIILDASLMPLDTITFDWDGFSEGYAYIPGLIYEYNSFFLPDGHVFYVSNPFSSYTLGADMYLEDGMDSWTYGFWNCCAVIGSPGQTPTFTVGGTFTTTIDVLGDPYYPGDTGILESTTEDAYGHVMDLLKFYDSDGSVPTAAGSKTEKIHSEPRTVDDRTLLLKSDNRASSSPEGDLNQAANFYILPEYSVEDALANPISGSLESSWFMAHYEFDIPDPTNVGTWQGAVTVEFGPYQVDGADTVSFEVLPSNDNVGFYVPDQLKWYLKNNQTNGWTDFVAFKFGGPSGSLAVSGDWDNDGVDTVGFYVPSQGKWYLKNNQITGWNDFVAFNFGGPTGSIPVAGDWDNDGVDTVGFYVPSQGKWYLKNNQINGWNDYIAFNFAGPTGSQPVAGDWDNDGVDTVGFYVPSQGKWYLKNNQINGWNDFVAVNFAGVTGSLAVAGDWDGDGEGTIGFYVPSQMKWYLKNNQNNGWFDYVSFNFGGPSGSQPVAGDWD